MRKIEISENSSKLENILYLYGSLSDLISGSKCRLEEQTEGDRIYLTLTAEDKYYEILRLETEDRIADIITISYKNGYISPAIAAGGLSDEEKQLLVSALISADLEDDKRYILSRIRGMESYTVDGIMNFRMKALKDKWDEVISYVPSYFGAGDLKEFIRCLLNQNGEKRVYISKEKVYDSHFRRLIRAFLLGGEGKLKLIKEVILSGSGRVELSGSIPKEDEYYLKEYYGERILFSR